MGKKRDCHCFVPGCSTQYKNNKISIFSPPNNEATLEKWKKLIPRSDKELTSKSGVCELHFEEDFIIRNYVHIVNGETVTIPRGRPVLKPDALPTIFPNLPAYLSVSLPKKRKSRDCSSTFDGIVVVEDEIPKRKISKISLSLDELKNAKLPTKFWGITVPVNERNSLIFHITLLHFSDNFPVLMAERLVIVKDENSKLKCEVFLKGLKVEEHEEITTKEMIENILTYVNLYPICEGAGSIKEFNDISSLPKQSKVYEDQIFSSKCNRKCTQGVCIHCKYLRKLLYHKRMRDSKKRTKFNHRYQSYYKSKAIKKLKTKVSSLKNDIKSSLIENKKLSKDSISEKIKKLPIKQQQMVQQCFKAAYRKSNQGINYTKNWVLECILMHMKSPKLYEHIRQNNIMCLPCRKTIRKYVSNYNSGFGFNEKTFEIISQKMKDDELYLRHGGLIIDEMKLTEKLQAKSCGQIEGFVDIGPYTPINMKSTHTNHGLVILFQPLVGKWSQIIGVFGTNNNISGDLLCKLIIEATVLSENAGLFVDFITCDAASWNRSMWKKFEISASLNHINNKICHPVDISRYLYFISDFPHLVKCLRNMFLSKGFLLPEGEARPEHIKAAWVEDSCKTTLKSMPKISHSHLQPNNFEKMRVSYAFQLFSLDVEKGLYLYKKEIEQQYGNSETTAKFVNRIRNLIDIMTARHPKNSLYLKSDKCEILLNFLKYLDEWETTVLTKNSKGFLSQSTASGLRVTIKSTLDLLDFLSEAAGFKYLMPSRLSQDTIENIFGIVRQSSGCNDHPTPYEFLITIQCLSFYNLAKSIKGGNCEQQIINSLVTCDDVEPATHLLEKLSEIFTENDLSRTNSIKRPESNILAQRTPESEILVFFSGYVIRKCVFKMKCESCNNNCLSSAADNEFVNSYIKHFDKGGLTYPTKTVVNLIHQLETIITEYFTSETLHRDSISDILEIIKKIGINYIGCADHDRVLTSNVVKFYLLCRLHFYIKGENKSNCSDEKMKYLKLHRLE